ncbi:hypothetical protein LTR66_000121 [Elasticomyces elasticus]|nr:hypothetical protein LTR66_000121 [Elasticomyces elasticus]
MALNSVTQDAMVCTHAASLHNGAGAMAISDLMASMSSDARDDKTHRADGERRRASSRRRSEAVDKHAHAMAQRPNIEQIRTARASYFSKSVEERRRDATDSTKAPGTPPVSVNRKGSTRKRTRRTQRAAQLETRTSEHSQERDAQAGGEDGEYVYGASRRPDSSARPHTQQLKPGSDIRARRHKPRHVTMARKTRAYATETRPTATNVGSNRDTRHEPALSMQIDVQGSSGATERCNQRLSQGIVRRDVTSMNPPSP